MTTEPTDDELAKLFTEETGFDVDDFPAASFGFARAALRSWGQPSGAGEVVYQASHKDGFWQDCSRERYEYLKALKISSSVDWTLRILYTTPQPTQAQAGAVQLTESEMGEGWRKFQETLDDRMAADPAGVRSMGREHWLSWAHWKAACNFARGIKGGQHGESV